MRPDSGLVAETIKSMLRELVRDCAAADWSDDALLREELGLESLDLFELVDQIERQFEIRLPEIDPIDGARTISELATVVVRRIDETGAEPAR